MAKTVTHDNTETRVKKPSRRPRRQRLRRRRAVLEGGLTLRDVDGNAVQEAPAQITRSLRALLARMQVKDGGVPSRLGLVAALGGEGVTSMTRALALVLANDTGKSVCIVDMNWWTPAPWPGEPDGGGLADVLRGSVPLKAALMATGSTGVSVLPAGAATITERPVLASSRQLGRVIDALNKAFDHVLLDLPPVYVASEAVTLAQHAGALAVVVRQGVTPENEVKHAIEELGELNVLGVILNRAYSKVPRVIRYRIPGL